MILISPYSAKLRTGAPNPKNYPFFLQLVGLLRHRRYQTTQIGVKGEERISGTDYFLTNKSFAELKKMASNAELILAVDNFFPHLCHAEKIKTPVIVLFGQSDPAIFGYPDEHIVMLKDRKYLRESQHRPWEEAEYVPEAFVSAQDVIWKIDEVIKQQVPEMRVTANLYA